MNEYISLPNIFIVLGALLSLAGSMLTTQKAEKEQKIFSNRLDEKNSEIIRLTKLNSALITGGDSFPLITPMFPINQREIVNFTASNQGSNPLYDLKIQITDQNRFKIEKKPTSADINNQKILLDINTLGNSQGVNLKAYPIDPSWTSFSFMFEMSARNGTFLELIRFYKLKNHWITAIRLSGGADQKVLFEEIHPEFPKDQLHW